MKRKAMHKILITGLLILFGLQGFGQSNDLNLSERFGNCDSTLTDYEVMDLLFHYRDVAKMNQNDGVLEDLQNLERNDAFPEIEKVCSEILDFNPINLTALTYYAIAQLGQEKEENITSSWDKTQMIYNAVKRFGKGTASAPFIVSDLNDAKALIYLYWEKGTEINSLKKSQEGIVNILISNSKGVNDTVSFNFDKSLNIREIYFDYHRDFQFYLAESASPQSEFYYETLLDRFQSHDKSLKNNEIIALMIGFTNNQNYHPYKNVEKEREIMELVGDKNYDKALMLSKELLKSNPVNFTALMEEGFSLWKINDDRSYFPSVKSRMIVDAILWSGTGSNTHSYFVLSPIDGQTIISYIFGENIGTMGSGDYSNGYFLDMLDMEKEGQETKTLYFNIDHAVNNSEFKKQIEKSLDKE
ncbi:DUF4919 domain-containing protein [Cyclobacterium sp. 1_MG-2023]|uniref:DUF4919 domain-containing protein n=1 Tax=Cyclobacterium sp. 1_MG-2023 TaxID=3062681 RepID=UPI0026E18E26|nr:DUF4919 domain-containing protein [Cyclobacterium sp. 1_MG-2023]MDO6439735.1 DUF4919 domain-containing protein [Cyclobacterium sp. 1_MG-2023]